MLTDHQLINQTSGDFEWYTPPEIIAAARRCMGGIGLDPFSSAAANKRVQADRYFTPKDDGFEQTWDALTVWCNHPFGRDYNDRAVKKMVAEEQLGAFREMCCITYACTSEKWFQPLLQRPQCFLSPRTNYYLPDGTLKKGVTKGSVVTYFGNKPAAFLKEFSVFGVVKNKLEPFVMPTFRR